MTPGTFAEAARAGGADTAPTTTAMILQCQGNTERYLGRLDAATGHLTEALAVFRALGHQAAGAHTALGAYAEAGHVAREAVALARDTGHRAGGGRRRRSGRGMPPTR